MQISVSRCSYIYLTTTCRNLRLLFLSFPWNFLELFVIQVGHMYLFESSAKSSKSNEVFIPKLKYLELRCYHERCSLVFGPNLSKKRKIVCSVSFKIKENSEFL